MCKACSDAGVEVKSGGVQSSMQAHLRKYPNQQKYDTEEQKSTSNNSKAEKKRKLTQLLNWLKALYAALDANLAFRWTDSVHVIKFFCLDEGRSQNV